MLQGLDPAPCIECHRSSEETGQPRRTLEHSTPFGEARLLIPIHVVDELGAPFRLGQRAATQHIESFGESAHSPPRLAISRRARNTPMADWSHGWGCGRSSRRPGARGPRYARARLRSKAWRRLRRSACARSNPREAVFRRRSSKRASAFSARSSREADQSSSVAGADRPARSPGGHRVPFAHRCYCLQLAAPTMGQILHWSAPGHHRVRRPRARRALRAPAGLRLRAPRCRADRGASRDRTRTGNDAS